MKKPQIIALALAVAFLFLYSVTNYQSQVRQSHDNYNQAYSMLSLVSQVKVLINEFSASHGRFPKNEEEIFTSNEELHPSTSPLDYTLEISEGGVFQINFQLGSNTQAKLLFVPRSTQSGLLRWSCAQSNLDHILPQLACENWDKSLSLLAKKQTGEFKTLFNNNGRSKKEGRFNQEYFDRIRNAAHQKTIPRDAHGNIKVAATPNCNNKNSHIKTLSANGQWRLFDTRSGSIIDSIKKPAAATTNASLYNNKLYYIADDQLYSLNINKTEKPQARELKINHAHQVQIKNNELNILSTKNTILIVKLCADQEEELLAPIVADGNDKAWAMAVSQSENILAVLSDEYNRPRAHGLISYLKADTQGGSSNWLSLIIDDNPNALIITDPYTFVANGESGITIINHTDPQQPAIVDVLKTRDYAKDIVLFNGHIVVADRQGGIGIVEKKLSEKDKMLFTYVTRAPQIKADKFIYEQSSNTTLFVFYQESLQAEIKFINNTLLIDRR